MMRREGIVIVVPKAFCLSLTVVVAVSVTAHGQGVVGTDGGWKGPVPEEFRVKREPPFAFAARPVVTRRGDEITVRFTTKTFCDVTVAIEEPGTEIAGEPKIVRHLACGVLGPEAPPPFQKNAKEQVVVWDGKNDLGEYIDDKDRLTVRVSLGLKPRFERTLLWSPHKQRGTQPIFAAAPEGVYVFDAGGVDYLRLFDHEGAYLRTIYPFPANKVKAVKGLRWYRFPQGRSWPLKESLYQQTLLTSGVNDSIYDRLGRTDAAATGIAVRGNRIALGYENLNSLAADGSSGGLPLKGPTMGYPFYNRRARTKRTIIIGPTSLAFSPDGKRLYFTGWAWITRVESDAVQAVKCLDYDSNDTAAVFAGAWSLTASGKGEKQFALPTSVACGPKGNVYVTDFLNNRVQIFSPAGSLLKSVGVEEPAQVLVHQRTGAIYVFSWAPYGIPTTNWYTFKKVRVAPALTSLTAYPECRRLSREPFPLGGTHGNRTSQGARYRVELDSWAPGDEPSFWITNNVWMASLEDHAYGYVSQTAQLAENRWINGVRILRKHDGKWKTAVSFGRLAKKAVKRINPIRHNIQELFVSPANGRLYVGEANSGPVSKAYDRLIEVDPLTGRHRIVQLPFNAEEMAFDINGLAHLRTTDVVARYDPETWREVPFDYGQELKHVGCGMGGRSADVIAGIRLPASHPACFHQGGMSISPQGHLVVACHDNGRKQAKKWEHGFAHFGVPFNFAAPYSPVMFPGRSSAGTVLHVWDRYGRPMRRDIVQGLPQLDGVHIDKDDNLYLMAWPTRTIGDKRYFNYMTETVMKFPTKGGRLLMSGKRAAIPLPDDLKPARPRDVSGRWVEDAAWYYGGAGHAGFNTPHAGGGCACWYCRFTLDYFARSFVPEMDQYSVAILDASGNLITRVGTYGNVDDGVPLIAKGGPANPRPLGPSTGSGQASDQVALFHAAYVGTHTDRRLFIADLGNARIVSVTLGYQSEAGVALRDVPDRSEAPTGADHDAP